MNWVWPSSNWQMQKTFKESTTSPSNKIKISTANSTWRNNKMQNYRDRSNNCTEKMIKPIYKSITWLQLLTIREETIPSLNILTNIFHQRLQRKEKMREHLSKTVIWGRSPTWRRNSDQNKIIWKERFSLCKWKYNRNQTTKKH